MNTSAFNSPKFSTPIKRKWDRRHPELFLKIKSYRDKGMTYEDVAKSIESEGILTTAGTPYTDANLCTILIQKDPSYRTNKKYKRRSTKSEIQNSNPIFIDQDGKQFKVNMITQAEMTKSMEGSQLREVKPKTLSDSQLIASLEASGHSAEQILDVLKRMK